MCVTSSRAEITGTRTFVYDTSRPGGTPVHVSGYQNEATTSGPNCMFLDFAGSNLEMVRGPEHTTSLMRDMTADLPSLEYIPVSRGGSFGAARGAKGISVEEYGDYTVILAQGPGNILDALEEVPAYRRPNRTLLLEEMVAFYQQFYPNDSFVLACFNGSAKPKHPITVSYAPRNPDVLTIPGLDGHDGNPPTVGAPIVRNFHVAFAIEGWQHPHEVNYGDLDLIVTRNTFMINDYPSSIRCLQVV